ncbi:MAG: YbfB/YjiJ family MFS transporter, partial [Actinomycetota bacterium]|nr:YbfB/YjiJ family MFS transporter [Actinomycetota bacterium]
MRSRVTLGDRTDGVVRFSGLPAVFLVAAVAAVAQSFGRFTYGVLLPAIRDDLGLSNTVAGSLGTANVAAYLVGTLTVASIAGRLRLLVIMRLGMVMAITGLGLAAIAPGARTLAAALSLAGFGGAFAWIPAPVVAARALAP